MWHKKIPIQIAVILTILTMLGLVIKVGSNNPTDQDYGQTSFLSEKPKIVLAVGDIACAPNDPNFNGGEGQNDVCQHKSVVEAMNKEQADLLLILGDIQYTNGELENFRQSFIPAYQQLKMPIMAIPGNHEYYGSFNAEGYRQAFKEGLPSAQALSSDGETYHSKQFGGWNIIGLDSNCEYIGGCDEGSKQAKWLKNDIDFRQCTLAFWHHPVFTNGIHQSKYETDRGTFFWNFLHQNKAELVLNGHEHFYERFSKMDPDGKPDPSGIREIIVGTGGRSLYGYKTLPSPPHEAGLTNKFGYLKLYLYSKSYKWEFIDITGKILDKGRDFCR